MKPAQFFQAALGYAAVIALKLASDGPPPGDVMTLAGLRDVFRDDWVFAAAWTRPGAA